MVLVCGSRDWEDVHAIRMRLVKLPPSATIIHGAAPGADRVAGWLAEDFGFTVKPFPADWKVGRHTRPQDIRTRADGTRYDSFAGKRRNPAMLDERPDLVLAFQRNGSGGTQHTIDEARKRGIPVEVHAA